METRTVLYGKNGVPFTYIRYAPTPLEQILAIGEREKCRKAIQEERERNTSYVKGLEIRKRIEQQVKRLEEEFGGKDSCEEYLSLTEGE